jgi:hypothetical protein
MWTLTAGSFSFPNVPPRAELEYDLELVDFEGVDEVLSSNQAPPHGLEPQGELPPLVCACMRVQKWVAFLGARDR